MKMPKTKAAMMKRERRETPAMEAKETRAYQKREMALGVEEHPKRAAKAMRRGR